MSDLSQVINGLIRYEWRDLATALEEPGVYAWYSNLFVSTADVDQFEQTVIEMRTKGGNVLEYIQERLDQLIFRRYREDNYQVQLTGALKPRFSGEALHQPTLSPGLLERLAEDPTRFRQIAEALSGAAPAFTAPLYIGMAKSLRERLMKHKTLIERLLDSRSNRGVSEIDDGDAGFARQIVARRFDPTNLFVHVRVVNVKSNEQVDVENILNRINFPIFGRN